MSDLNSWERNQHKKEAVKAAVQILRVRFEELLKLNKSEQEKILNKQGIKIIPKTEIERVVKIIQMEKN